MVELRLNDGSTGVFNASKVSEADILALGSDLEHGDELPAPFTWLRYSWCPKFDGIRFSIFDGTRQLLTNATAVEQEAGEGVWARLMETCGKFQHGLTPAELQQGDDELDYEDTTTQLHAAGIGST